MPSDIRSRLKVPPERQRVTCDPETAVPSDDASEIIGQEEALEAVRLGLEMTEGDYAQRHYNVLVVGPRSTGRLKKTLTYVRQHAAETPATPPDVICIPDLTNRRRPITAYLPTGQGSEFKKHLTRLHELITNDLQKALVLLRTERLKKMMEQLTALVAETRTKMEAFGFTLIEFDEGVKMGPLSMNTPGEVMSDEELEELQKESPDIVETLMGEEMRGEADKLLAAMTDQVRKLNRETEKANRDRDEMLIKKALERKMKPLIEMAAGNEQIETYLQGVKRLLLQAGLKQGDKDSGPNHPMTQMLGQKTDDGEGDPLLIACTVNLLVDNSQQQTAPVLHVKVPNYSDLFGRINIQMNRNGGISIDHTMVDSGAILQANGGFLVIDLDDLLQYGGGLTFFKLLATLRSAQLRIESKGGFLDVGPVDFHTKDLPIQVRVVAICSPWLGLLLRRHVELADDLFRINSEFETDMPLQTAPGTYAAFVELCRSAEPTLPEFTPGAVARLVEHGIRRTGDRNKATTEFGWLKDLINEAAHWSHQAGSDTVMSWHIDHTMSQKFERSAMHVRRYREHLERGTLIWNDSGATVGQVNGLAVLQVTREVVFGTPSRITCRAFAGKGEVALVQRDVKTSGPSSNTAVSVIQGWLSGQYGRKKTIGLGVQLNFEQCYGGVDGDSASLAETVAIVSAITGLPIDQRLSITGSMDQWGQAQPIGGVNHKLEGHFDALQRRGKLQPDSGHGGIIPIQNLDGLMLDHRLVEASAQGKYTVYAVSHVDEVLELLLGQSADSIHQQVRRALADPEPHPWYRRLWPWSKSKKPAAK